MGAFDKFQEDRAIQRRITWIQEGAKLENREEARLYINIHNALLSSLGNGKRKWNAAQNHIEAIKSNGKAKGVWAEVGGAEPELAPMS